MTIKKVEKIVKRKFIYQFALFKNKGNNDYFKNTLNDLNKKLTDYSKFFDYFKQTWILNFKSGVLNYSKITKLLNRLFSYVFLIFCSLNILRTRK